jgi:cell division protein FtsB
MTHYTLNAKTQEIFAEMDRKKESAEQIISSQLLRIFGDDYATLDARQCDDLASAYYYRKGEIKSQKQTIEELDDRVAELELQVSKLKTALRVVTD